jgi:valyl-tRNA synthetase
MHINEDCLSFDHKHLSLQDKWILSGMRCVTEDVVLFIENYQFNEAASVLYQFVWHKFCDWYLEAAKPVLYGKYGADKEKTGKAVLYTVLKNTLILLHPLIPFVTEEIWSKLPNSSKSIMQAVFPLDNPLTEKTVVVYKEAEEHMDLLINIITGIRTVRGEMNISPSLSLNVIVHTPDEVVIKVLKEHKNILLNLARLDEITIGKPDVRPVKAATAIVDSATVFVLLEGVVDFSNEVLRLSKEIKKAEKELIGMSKKLANESFLSKAPADVVEKVKIKHENLLQKTDKLKFNLDKIKELQD